MVHRARHSSLLFCFFCGPELKHAAPPHSSSNKHGWTEQGRWIIGLKPSAAAPPQDSHCWFTQEDWTWRECLQWETKAAKLWVWQPLTKRLQRDRPHPAERLTLLHAKHRLNTAFAFMETMLLNTSSTEETLDLMHWSSPKQF